VLTLLCVTYRRFDLLERMIKSAKEGSRVPDRFLLLSNGGNIEDYAKKQRFDTWGVNIEPKNLGRVSVAKAWNTGFVEDTTIVTGDDVVFGKDTLRDLETAAITSRALFLYPLVNASEMFCVFTAKMCLFDMIGRFDEQFFPAYFEDNDFFRRMKIAGVEAEAVAVCDAYRHETSSTLKSMNGEEQEEHHRQFRENQRRYMNKWGGLPGAEIYDTPRP
jgi:GT2 family glycosyltransferase